jgi:hypothetical protein
MAIRPGCPVLICSNDITGLQAASRLKHCSVFPVANLHTFNRHCESPFPPRIAEVQTKLVNLLSGEVKNGIQARSGSPPYPLILYKGLETRLQDVGMSRVSTFSFCGEHVRRQGAGREMQKCSMLQYLIAEQKACQLAEAFLWISVSWQSHKYQSSTIKRTNIWQSGICQLLRDVIHGTCRGRLETVSKVAIFFFFFIAIIFEQMRFGRGVNVIFEK